MINYYETLGVRPSATGEEIKGRYRQLAKRFHPDMVGGDPVVFARVCEAYEVLSEPRRRQAFDRALKTAQREREEREARRVQRRRGFRGAERPAAASPPPSRPGDPGPPVTRVMSLSVGGQGRFLLEGLDGHFTIRPTTPEGLWDTTLRKFGDGNREGLAARTIQIRVKGPRDWVRQLAPVPTDYGVQFQGTRKDLFGGLGPDAAAFVGGRGGPEPGQPMTAPVTVEVTLPRGIPLYLYDLSGRIEVGDLDSEIVAQILGKALLRCGRTRAANITLDGEVMTYLSDVQGPADLIVAGHSKILVGGGLTRLRAVLENQAHVEVIGPVKQLQASVHGRGYLNVKSPVDDAHCDVRGGGYARLAKVTRSLGGNRSGGGYVDVVQRPPASAPPRFGFGAR